MITALLLFCIFKQDDFWNRWYSVETLRDETIGEFIGDCVVSFGEWHKTEFDDTQWNAMLKCMATSENQVEVFALFAGSSGVLYANRPWEPVDDEIELRMQTQLVEFLRQPQFLRRYHWFGIWSQSLKFHGYAASKHCIEWSSIDREQREIEELFANLSGKSKLDEIFVCKRVIELFHITGCDAFVRSVVPSDINQVQQTFVEWQRWIRINRRNLMGVRNSWRFEYCPVVGQMIYQCQRIALWTNFWQSNGEDPIELLLMPAWGPYFVFGYPSTPIKDWSRKPLQRYWLGGN